MTGIVDLVQEDPRWSDVNLEDLAERAARLALTAAGVEGQEVEISLLACSDDAIARLNSDFRGKESATNVLSWPAFDLFADEPGGMPSRDLPQDEFGPTGLGDVAIAYETVLAEAQDGGIPLDNHIVHLILHACLHLLGYDHQTELDATLMESLEVEALASVGVASPY